MRPVNDSTTEPTNTIEIATDPIVFFDGVCGLCNGIVDVLLKIDRERVLRFAPLQGHTARRLNMDTDVKPSMRSLIYVDEKGCYYQSDAAFEILRRLGSGWRILASGRAFPRSVRDGIYGLVARNRYQWFGRTGTCRVPTAEEQARFLP